MLSPCPRVQVPYSSPQEALGIARLRALSLSLTQAPPGCLYPATSRARAHLQPHWTQAPEVAKPTCAHLHLGHVMEPGGGRTATCFGWTSSTGCFADCGRSPPPRVFPERTARDKPLLPVLSGGMHRSPVAMERHHPREVRPSVGHRAGGAAGSGWGCFLFVLAHIGMTALGRKRPLTRTRRHASSAGRSLGFAISSPIAGQPSSSTSALERFGDEHRGKAQRTGGRIEERSQRTSLRGFSSKNPCRLDKTQARSDRRHPPRPWHAVR